MNPETSITMVPEMEVGNSQRMAEVRFDCLVRMFDFGQRHPNVTVPFLNRKPFPPQWFKLETRLTLDFIELHDEREIGRVVKDQWRQLKQRIEEYEKHSK